MVAGPLIILLAVLVYGFVHSLLASLAAKARARQWFGPGVCRWYRLFYNVFGVVTLLPVFAIAAILPDQGLYAIPTPWSYLTFAVQLLALLVLGIGLLQTGLWSFLGLQQLVDPTVDESTQMVTSGFYRWVRHPLYTAGLVIIWLVPLMTYNILALIVGLTIYLVVGAYYEERKLVRVFGTAYTSYQQRTPMLIPGIGKGILNRSSMDQDSSSE